MAVGDSDQSRGIPIQSQVAFPLVRRAQQGARRLSSWWLRGFAEMAGQRPGDLVAREDRPDSFWPIDPFWGHPVRVPRSRSHPPPFCARWIQPEGGSLATGLIEWLFSVHRLALPSAWTWAEMWA